MRPEDGDVGSFGDAGYVLCSLVKDSGIGVLRFNALKDEIVRHLPKHPYKLAFLRALPLKS